MLTVIFARACCVYYSDWAQMAADMLAVKYPSIFGKREGMDDELDDDEAPA